MQLREIRIDGSEIRAVKNGHDATYIMSQVKVSSIFYFVFGFTNIRIYFSLNFFSSHFLINTFLHLCFNLISRSVVNNAHHLTTDIFIDVRKIKNI